MQNPNIIKIPEFLDNQIRGIVKDVTRKMLKHGYYKYGLEITENFKLKVIIDASGCTEQRKKSVDQIKYTEVREAECPQGFHSEDENLIYINYNYALNKYRFPFYDEGGRVHQGSRAYDKFIMFDVIYWILYHEVVHALDSEKVEEFEKENKYLDLEVEKTAHWSQILHDVRHVTTVMLNRKGLPEFDTENEDKNVKKIYEFIEPVSKNNTMFMYYWKNYPEFQDLVFKEVTDTIDEYIEQEVQLNPFDEDCYE